MHSSDEIIMKMNDEVSDRFVLYFHHKSRRPPMTQVTPIIIQGKSNKKIEIHSRVESFLKSPYKSNCKDYEIESDYGTRDNCLMKCYLEQGLKRCNVVHDRVLLTIPNQTEP